MTNSYLSAEPVSTDYLTRLHSDLDGAEIVRFAVAFVSSRGLRKVGVERLATALQASGHSFGVASLNCACKVAPLYELQAEAGVGRRLCYFVGTLDERKGRGEVPDFSLMHSKVVYVVKSVDGQRRSITYLGSHNWSHTALVSTDDLDEKGVPRQRVNAEFSTRVEQVFEAAHLEGAGGGAAAAANAHLLWLFSKSGLALPVDREHRSEFDLWVERVCEVGTDRDETTVLNVVCDPISREWARVKPTVWSSLAGEGIKIEAIGDQLGEAIWSRRGPVLVRAWRKREHLKEGYEPVLLKGRLSTLVAFEGATLGGSNHSKDPVQGHVALIYSSAQRSETGSARDDVETLEAVPLGLGYEHAKIMDLALPSDAPLPETAEHLYEFMFEVERVYLPVLTAEKHPQGTLPSGVGLYSALLFPVGGLGVSRRDRRLKTRLRTAERRATLRDVFGVDLERAKGVPVEPNPDEVAEAMWRDHALTARRSRPEMVRELASRHDIPLAVAPLDQEEVEEAPVVYQVRHPRWVVLERAWRELAHQMRRPFGFDPSEEG